MKYLVVGNDPRIPYSLNPDECRKMTGDEFREAASNGEGLDCEEVYYNIDAIDEGMYNALKEYGESIIYFKFDNQLIGRPEYFDSNTRIKNYKKVTKENSQSVTQQTASPASNASQAGQSNNEPVNKEYTSVGVDILEGGDKLNTPSRESRELNWGILIDGPNTQVEERPKNAKPATVILFGSSKGGTGKTFTCLLTAYRYAKTHPNERVALADFDIIDGQIGVTIAKPNPTLLNYYKLYKAGRKTFADLNTCHVNSEHFSPNIDFYLAPEMDFPEVTNNNEFWQNVFQLLITNYDVIFFDSGIDYLGKAPISKLYKIADRIIITSNTSINSISSVVKQLKTLAGIRKNNVFLAEKNLLKNLRVVLTRVSPNSDINKVAMDAISKYARIIAAFSNLDDQISRTQWYQEWEAWDNYPDVCKYLDRIADTHD